MPSTTTRGSTRSRSRCPLWQRSGSSTTGSARRRRAGRREACSIAGAIRRSTVADPRTTCGSSTSTTFAGSRTAGRARGISRSSTTVESVRKVRSRRSTSGRPALGPDGRYAIVDAEPFGPSNLAWQFTAEEPTDFFSPFISGAHRLENGNTMICSGTGGRLLEVTRAGEIVWEYRNPFSGEVRNDDGSMPQPGLESSPYAVFRATRLSVDHAALAGRVPQPLDPQPAWFENAPNESSD